MLIERRNAMVRPFLACLFFFLGVARSEMTLENWRKTPHGTQVVRFSENILTFQNDEGIQVSASSPPLTYNHDKVVPLEFGCSLRGDPDFKAESWHCFVGLTDIVYQDGSKGEWIVIGSLEKGLSADQWNQRSRSWLPPKPVKSLRLRAEFHAKGKLELKELFCREAPEKMAELLSLGTKTFLPFQSKVKHLPIPAIVEPLRHASHFFTWEDIYPKANFIWKIGQLNGSAAEFANRHMIGKEGLDFDTASNDWGKHFCGVFLGANRSGGNARVRKTNIYFQIPETGTYTIITAFAGGKNLVNRIGLSLNGKLLQQYCIDGNHPGGKRGQLNRFAEPLELTAGKHCLTLEHQAGGFITLDAMAVLQGTARAQYLAEEFLPLDVKPLFWTDAISTRNDPLLAAGDSNIGGNDCDIILTQPPGEYRLAMTFAESFDQETNLVAKAGIRLFDVSINGKLVHPGFDIQAESGGNSFCKKNFLVSSSDGKIVIRLQAKSELPARISAISVYDATGQNLIADYQFTPRYVNLEYSRNGFYASPYNLVANPGMEYANEQGQVCWWELSEGASAVQSREAAFEGRSGLQLTPGKSSATLRSMVNADITWDRPYRVACKIKATGDIKVRLKLLWMRYQVQYKADIIKEFSLAKRRYQHEHAGCSFGEWFTPDEKWRDLEFTAFPPRTADGMGFALEFSGSGQLFVDDFFCDIRGEIPVEIFVSQAGYDRLGSKTAVVFSRNHPGGGRYLIRKADNRPVKNGVLEHLGKQPWHLPESEVIADSLWNREVWQIDFSDLQENGRYTLEVFFDDGQAQRTPVWEIRDQLYHWLGRFVITEYYPVVRCGTEVPGWHPPCHCDDGDILIDGKRKHFPVTGGWHDAGDNNIFNWNIIHSAWAMAMFLDNTVQDQKVHEEMQWGLDYQVRGQGEDGRLIQTIKNYPDHSITVRPDRQTDGDPNTPDNRVLAHGLWIHPSMAAAIALIQSAPTLPPEKAKTYLHCANRIIKYFDADKSIENTAIAPYRLLLALAMEKADYRFCRKFNAKEETEIILRAFEDGTHWVRWNHNYDSESVWQFHPIQALCEYVRSHPAEAAEVKALLRRHCDTVLLPLCDQAPFQQMTEYRLQDAIFCKFSEGGTYDISYRYYAAGAMAACAEVLEDEKLLERAEAQIFWGVGLNPCGVSSIAGIGWRQQNAFCVSAPEFYGKENGQYPGVTQHGPVHSIRPFVQKIWPDPPSEIPPFLGMPTGSRHAGILGDTPTFGRGAEQYIAHACAFIYACGEIHRATQTLKVQK